MTTGGGHKGTPRCQPYTCQHSQESPQPCDLAAVQPTSRKCPHGRGAMQENTEGTSAPASEDIVKAQIAHPAVPLSQQGAVPPLLHGSGCQPKPQPGEAVLGARRFYPSHPVQTHLSGTPGKEGPLAQNMYFLALPQPQANWCPGESPLSPEVPAPASSETPGQAPPLSQCTETGSSHRHFASWLEATQVHENNPGRRNKTYQYYKKKPPAKETFTFILTSTFLYFCHMLMHFPNLPQDASFSAYLADA